MSGNPPSSPTRLRAIIVDDEPLAREGLLAAVARLSIPGVEVIASCENGVAALDVIRREEPEIVLLDIAMPVLDGFAMLEQLEPEATPPTIIFVTAYDEHALRAFDVEATGFLVKPVSDDKLRGALDRAVRRVAESRALRSTLVPAANEADGGYLRQLVIPERERQLVVPVDEIEWIEGDTYYVRVHTGGRARLLRERLSRLETLLDPSLFHRTHRSALVRLDLIREIAAESPYSHAAVLASGARVPVSRERLKGLQDALRKSSAASRSN
jgi:two-component system, LytTR family, response regulator